MNVKNRTMLAGTAALLALSVLGFGTPPPLLAQKIPRNQNKLSQSIKPFATTTDQITLKDYEAYVVSDKGEGWTSGKITGYGAGDLILFRITVEANGAASGQFQVRFTGDNAKCLAFDDFFVFNTLEYVSGDFPTVSLVGNPTTSDFPVAEDFGTPKGEWVVAYDINFQAAGEARIYHVLKLSDQAGNCGGAPPHSRLNPSEGDVDKSGSQKLSVRVK